MGGGTKDTELIQGCLEGRKGSWDIFVERYSRLVYWSIWKTLERQNVPDKEELCREVFQDFFERVLERARLERLLAAENLKTYIRTIVCHLVFDRLRDASRRDRSESPLDVLGPEAFAGAGPDAREIALGREVEDVLRSAVGALSTKEKACLELCYTDGRTHREISLLLNMPQDTVSSILRRAKERLRETLKEKGILE